MVRRSVDWTGKKRHVAVNGSSRRGSSAHKLSNLVLRGGHPHSQEVTYHGQPSQSLVPPLAKVKTAHQHPVLPKDDIGKVVTWATPRILV
jgi:hypothetical protein